MLTGILDIINPSFPNVITLQRGFGSSESIVLVAISILYGLFFPIKTVKTVVINNPTKYIIPFKSQFINDCNAKNVTNKNGASLKAKYTILEKF